MTPLLKLSLSLLKPLFWLLLAITTFLMLIELKPQAAGWIYADKLQHIIVFMTLALIGILAYFEKMWLVISGLLMFGLIIEILQSAFTLTRQASLADWLADLAGIAIAIGIVAIIKKFKNSLLLIR